MQATIDGTPKRPFLPFLKRFYDPIREGVKVCTLRSRRYGEPGDLLNTPVGLVRLVDVERSTAEWVMENRWRQEGCASPHDFLMVWDSIHPPGGSLVKPMWLHTFEWVGPECTNNGPDVKP